MLKYLLVSISGLALATAANAQAQSAQESAALEDASPNAGIAEIVVTASRRAENAQRSALSIQALSSEALIRANVTKPEDLNAIATGVQIGTAGPFPQVYVRGVGSYNTQTTGDSAVAFNLDGVYISRPWATRGMFYDLERVEVLKGPQGTLYGRNASGGAINVITAKPKLGEVTGFAEMEVGNYNLVEGTGALNLPVGDTVAIRASGKVTSRDGYLSDGYDDDKTQAARLQLLWKPSEDFSLLLHGNYQHVGGKGEGPVLAPRLRGQKFQGASDPDVTAIFQAEPSPVPGFIPPFGQLNTFPKDDGYLDLTVYAVGAEMNWNLGFATLTVLPAYREASFRSLHYLPGFSVENNERNDQTTLEVRLGNSGEKLKWVLGAYYFDENGGNLPGHANLQVLQGINTQTQETLDLNTRSYAAFGQATYSVTDQFRVTGGLRYTYERKKFDERLVNVSFPTFPPLTSTVVVEDPQQRTFNSVTWKAGAEFDVGPHSMAYANASTGFKSGGFYSAPPPNSYDPEKMTAFDAGIKNRFFDNRLQVNIEAFYWKYKDHQESFIGPTTIPGFFTFVTVNAGRATTYGADLDLLFLPTPRDELSVKVQYNKTKYDSFSFLYPSASGRFGPVVTGCAATPYSPVGPDQIVSCDGKPLVRAPLWTGNVGYSHTFDLGERGNLRASFDAQFASKSYLSIDFLESGQQKAYAVGNFDLTYTSSSGKVSVSAYVRNIWNEEVKTQAYRSSFVSGSPVNPLASADGVILATVRPPRMYGGRVRVNF